MQEKCLKLGFNAKMQWGTNGAHRKSHIRYCLCVCKYACVFHITELICFPALFYAFVFAHVHSDGISG